MNVVLDYGLIVLITVAIVNRIKAEAPTLKSFFYTLISIAIGAGLFAVSIYASDIIKGFIFIGLAASGIYDVYKRQ